MTSDALATLDRVRAAFEPAAEIFGSATYPDLVERERQLAEMAKQLRIETRRRERAEKALDDILASRSWRLTRPLRRVRTRSKDPSSPPRPTE